MDGLRSPVGGKRRALALGVVALIAIASGACRDVQGKAPSTADTSYRLRPGYVIDSVKPVEVELAEFRAGLGPPATQLVGGDTSLARLLARFGRAVQANDSAALDRLQITPAEFAWLIYPSSPYTKPPFRESPQMIWYQLRSSGATGLARLLKRRGGKPLPIKGYRCDPKPLIEEQNRLWRRCEVETSGATSRDTTRERLFGVVIERQGRFKFASYQNQY